MKMVENKPVLICAPNIHVNYLFTGSNVIKKEVMIKNFITYKTSFIYKASLGKGEVSGSSPDEGMP